MKGIVDNQALGIKALLARYAGAYYNIVKTMPVTVMEEKIRYG